MSNSNSDQQKHVLQKVSNTIQAYVGFFCNGIGKTLADISLYCYFSLVLFSNQSDKKQEPNKKLNWFDMILKQIETRPVKG